MNSLRTLVLSSSSSLATMIQLINAISVVLYGTKSAILSSLTIRLKRYLCFFSVCYLRVEQNDVKMTICKKTQIKSRNSIFFFFFFFGWVGWDEYLRFGFLFLILTIILGVCFSREMMWNKWIPVKHTNFKGKILKLKPNLTNSNIVIVWCHIYHSVFFKFAFSFFKTKNKLRLKKNPDQLNIAICTFFFKVQVPD